MAKIHYVLGDATEPQGPGAKIIAHVCNDYGGWGRGFVLALSAKDDRPERRYRSAAAEHPLLLGDVLMAPFGPAQDNTFVANMVAQHGNSTPQNPVAISYSALVACLTAVAEEAHERDASVHMPRIGCGLGGGSWEKIEPIISGTLIDLFDIDVYVYDLPTPAAIEDHHLMDAADEKFQNALHDLAARSVTCGQPLPQTKEV